MPIVSAFRRWGQEDQESKVLGYIASQDQPRLQGDPALNIKKSSKKKIKSPLGD